MMDLIKAISSSSSLLSLRLLVILYWMRLHACEWHGIMPPVLKNPIVKMKEGIRVYAYGDFNSDRCDDLFCMTSDQKSIQIYLWDTMTKGFALKPKATISWQGDAEEILALTPSDFTLDGHLDLLVSFYRSGNTQEVFHRLYAGDGETLGQFNQCAY
jgi:hypothetical protein